MTGVAGKAEGEVWKVVATEYYTRALKRPNAYGRYSTACRRKVTDWAAMIGGKVVRGFSTRRSAIAAVEEARSIL